MRKSLKQLPRKLVHFASALKRKGIRYKIGKRSIEIYFRAIYSNLSVSRITIRFNKGIFVFIHSYGVDKDSFDSVDGAIQHIVTLLKQAYAWQKNGVKFR